LAATYAEKRISDDSRRKSWCWRSWSAAISQINRQAQNPLKEINYKTPKEILRTLKLVSVNKIQVSKKRKKIAIKDKDK